MTFVAAKASPVDITGGSEVFNFTAHFENSGDFNCDQELPVAHSCSFTDIIVDAIL